MERVGRQHEQNRPCDLEESDRVVWNLVATVEVLGRATVRRAVVEERERLRMERARRERLAMAWIDRGEGLFVLRVFVTDARVSRSESSMNIVKVEGPTGLDVVRAFGRWVGRRQGLGWSGSRGCTFGFRGGTCVTPTLDFDPRQTIHLRVCLSETR